MGKNLTPSKNRTSSKKFWLTNVGKVVSQKAGQLAAIHPCENS